jgi:hypothetical protein
VIRRPEFLPGQEWEETFTVLEVIGAYRDPRHGRVLEFYTTERQLRTIKMLDIELSVGTIRQLQRMNLHP